LIFLETSFAPIRQATFTEAKTLNGTQSRDVTSSRRQHRHALHCLARPAQPAVIHPEVRPISPSLPTMVGEAFTLRYIPARSPEPISVFQD
jgi:regulator of RNase E activity RraA